MTKSKKTSHVDRLACRFQIRVLRDKLSQINLKFAKLAKVSPIKVAKMSDINLRRSKAVSSWID